MKLKVNITKDVLERSKDCRKSKLDQSCAIALAMKPMFYDAWVSTDYVYLYDNTITNLPKEAIIFIEKFDSALPSERVLMPELSFEVELPDDFDMTIDEVTDRLKDCETLELIR